METHSGNRKEKTTVRLLFFLLLGGLVAFQACIYICYNLKWVDTDQFFMWAGLSDFSQGRFYEPRYYAQNYNTFLEALLAVPFYKMGLPVWQAVPLATHLLFLAPILSTAILLFRADRHWQALSFLALLLCMNPAYFLLNAQPRGFVTGLFFCSFYAQSFLYPERRSWLFFNTAAGLLAFFVNPNSLLLTVPMLAFLFYHHHRHLWYYGLTAIAAGLYLPLDLFFNQFYRTHPEYIKTNLIMEFGLRYLQENLSQLNATFAQLSPFVEQQAVWLLLPFGALFYLILRQKNKALLFAFGSFLLLLLISMCISKTRDGSVWVYLSYSRMYLALPLLFALLLAQVQLSARLARYVLIPAALINLTINFTTHEERLRWHFEEQNWNALSLISLESTQQVSGFYGQKCKEQGADFILVSHRFWAVNTICYAGKALDKDYPNNMETTWDKRYAVRQTFEGKVVPKFVLLSTTFNIAEKMAQDAGFQITKLDDYGLALITGNTLPMADFIRLERKYEMPY